MPARRLSVRRGADRLSSGGLRARRRRQRRRVVIVVSVLALFVIGGIIYGLWQPAVRVEHITVSNGNASLQSIAQADLQGTYLGILPRDSIFFFPAGSIRRDILAADAQYAAVSVKHVGFDRIALRPDLRDAIGQWCGEHPPLDASTTPSCYTFDGNGLIFAFGASTTPTVNGFKLYAPLAGNALLPIRATIAHANALPSVFDFARQVGQKGAPVVSIVIQAASDATSTATSTAMSKAQAPEVDDYLSSGTEIRYVLGQEQQAFAALSSAGSDLNLTDGSVQYVDLRFPGKVYVKKNPSAHG